MPPPPTSPDLTRPQEASQDITEVRIAEVNAITLSDAVLIAEHQNVSLGKSTLQRWAKHWLDHPQAGVKVVLQVTRTGRHYELDRDDFESWLIDQARNQQASRDPERPHEASAGERPPRSTTHDDGDQQQLDKLRAENTELKDQNMQLKIDLGARKQLLAQTAKEFERKDAQLETLLRENGSLQFQVRQLSAGSEHHRIAAGARGDADGQGSGATGESPFSDVDNSRAGEMADL